MFSAIRSRITYVNVVATLVLVFVMTGGALAAKKYLITSTKQISPSVLKSLQGKAGPAGANGAQGAAGVGTAGAQGPAGPAGPAGTGTEGKEGKAGTSVTSKALAKGEGGCPEGGSEFTSASGRASACNGIKGEKGTNGTTGFTETLPGGKTETGTWGFGFLPATPNGFFHVPISFSIPLAAPLTGTNCESNPPGTTCRIHYIDAAGKEVLILGPPNTEIASTVCTGSAAAPTATPGNLCVYTGKVENAKSRNSLIIKPESPESQEIPGASTAGALLGFEGVAEEAVGWGTWAVTAEAE